jgi:hypothetical protein
VHSTDAVITGVNMLAAVLFLCIGFMIAVLYIDLVFDFSGLPHRRSGRPLAPAILDPIATYYRYITRNPYLLMFIMATAAACIVGQIFFELVPRWIGHASLLVIVLNTLIAALKVIPAAQRLASGRDNAELQSQIVHSLLPYHVVLLIAVLLLMVMQLIAAAKQL